MFRLLTVSWRRIKNFRQVSYMHLLPTMICGARRWTSSRSFLCSLVRLECHAGHAYSKPGRTAEEVIHRNARSFEFLCKPKFVGGSVYSSPLSLGGESESVGGFGQVADGLSQKKHRRRKDRATFIVGVLGGGIPVPSRLGGLAERIKLPQWGSGRSPARKRILCTLELSESHWWL